MKTALIMAGGTGGHVFPALAVARALTARGVAVIWLGTRKGIEQRLIPEAELPIHFLHVEGVRGKGLMGLIKAPFFIVSALLQALLIIQKEKPDIVIGFGGFVSGPGGVAAWILRLPLLIHEQNAIAGTTNRLLSKIATCVATGFDDVFKKAVWIGNPVRQSISTLPAPAERLMNRDEASINLLILGGSLGAKAINQLLPEALSGLPPVCRINVWHQTGEKHLQATLADYMKHKVNAKVDAFIEDMAEAYAWADVVFCRAGALTVAELMAAGLGALLIPLPSAIDDHQSHNAAVLVRGNAGLSMAQSDLTPESLIEILVNKLSDRKTLVGLAERARLMRKPDAAEDMANLAWELVNG